jgi:hypothetical protein
MSETGGAMTMIRRAKPWRRHLPLPKKIILKGDKTMKRTFDEARPSEATGRDPRDAGGMAEPADGNARTETINVAQEPRADTGNVEHTYDVAMTTSEIKGWQKP